MVFNRVNTLGTIVPTPGRFHNIHKQRDRPAPSGESGKAGIGDAVPYFGLEDVGLPVMLTPEQLESLPSRVASGDEQYNQT